MRDILRELVTGNYSAEPKPNPEQYKQMMKLEELWEKVEEQIGKELREALEAAEYEVVFENDLQWYREGFRLGARLMLELL